MSHDSSLLYFYASAVTWYKDGRPLTGAAAVPIRKRGQVLEIEQAQLSDAGIYKCVAVNLAGAAEKVYSLQVFGWCFAGVIILSLYQRPYPTILEIFLLTVPPEISSRGGTVTAVVNEAVKLECEASGVPVPSLTWLKDGSPVASVSHGIQVQIKSLAS